MTIKTGALLYKMWSSIVLGLAFVSATFAVTPEDGEKLKEKAMEQHQIDEVIIVARQASQVGKLDVALKDLPQNVSVISRDTLDSFGKPRLEDISYSTVGLHAVAPQYGTTNYGFFARGFNGATVVVDGYYSSNNAFGSVGAIDMAAVETVEVLRGPAAILYGQGNPAGVVNLTSKRPQSDFAFDVSGYADSHGGRRIETDITGPLSDGVDARVVGVREDSESFRDFITHERTLIAPSLTVQAHEDIQVRLRYSFDELTFVPDNGPGFNGDLIENLEPETNVGEPWQPTSTTENRDWRVEADWDFAPDWKARIGYTHHETNIPDGLFEIDADCTVGDPTCFGSGAGTLIDRVYITTIVPSNNSVEHSMATAQLLGKFTTGNIGHTITASVDVIDNFTNYDYDYGYFGTIDYRNPVYSAAAPAMVSWFTGEGAFQSDVKAVSIQDLLAFSDKWKLLVGLRRDEIITVGYAEPSAVTATNRSEETKITPRLGLVYQPNEQTTFYASYSEAFSPLVGLDSRGEAYKPEDSRSFEFGLRQEFGSRLLLSAAIYDIEKKNIIIVDPNPPMPPPPGAGGNINAGVAGSRGFEMELQGRITESWWINAGLAYTRAEIIESVDPISFPEEDELPGTPPWSALLSSRWQINDALELGARLSYASSRQYMVPNTESKLESYGRVDLFADHALSQNVTVQFNVLNASDERILLPNGYGRAQIDLPRTYSLNLRYQFD